MKQGKEVLVGNMPILWVAMATQDSDTVGHESEILGEVKKKGGEKKKMFDVQLSNVYHIQTEDTEVY